MQAGNKICPFCAEEIKADAIICKHCGTNLKTGNQPQTVVKKKKDNGCVILLLVGFIALVIYFIVSPKDSNSKNSSADEMNFKAYVVAEGRVQDQLKTPSKAEFPASSKAQINSQPDNIWIVSSYVDSQNSFGAMIRSYWTITLKYIGNDPDRYENWKTIKLSIK